MKRWKWVILCEHPANSLFLYHLWINVKTHYALMETGDAFLMPEHFSVSKYVRRLGVFRTFSCTYTLFVFCHLARKVYRQKKHLLCKLHINFRTKAIKSELREWTHLRNGTQFRYNISFFPFKFCFSWNMRITLHNTCAIMRHFRKICQAKQNEMKWKY